MAVFHTDHSLSDDLPTLASVLPFNLFFGPSIADYDLTPIENGIFFQIMVPFWLILFLLPCEESSFRLYELFSKNSPLGAHYQPFFIFGFRVLAKTPFNGLHFVNLPNLVVESRENLIDRNEVGNFGPF